MAVDPLPPQPPPGRIGRGDILEPVEALTRMALSLLRLEQPFAYASLIKKCRDSSTEIPGPDRTVLHARRLLTSRERDGSLASGVREVAIAYDDVHGPRTDPPDVRPAPGYPTGDQAAFGEGRED